jgi:DNA gyrase/topoisomerase IV subunit A
VNYDFEYIKSVFIKANELKTIIDQPIDLQKIINCHERIANDYYKKLKQTERQETKPKQEEIDYSDFSTYRPY